MAHLFISSAMLHCLVKIPVNRLRLYYFLNAVWHQALPLFAVAALIRLDAMVALGYWPPVAHLLHALRGFSSDLAMTLAVVPLLLSVRHDRLAHQAMVVLWCYALAANRIYIGLTTTDLIKGAAMQTDFANHWRTAVFSFKTLIYTGAFFFVHQLISDFLQQRAIRLAAQQKLIIVAAFLLLLLKPFSITVPPWQQQSIAEEKLSQLAGKHLAASTHSELQQHDLSGTPYFTPVRKHPNILMIVIDGLSMRDMKDKFMPYLATLQNKYLHFPNFIVPARQTQQGLYALLCGDIPSLLIEKTKAGVLETTNKWDAVNARGSKHPCLPARLKQLNYSTLYMQSFDDESLHQSYFCMRAGFDACLSANDFPHLSRSYRDSSGEESHETNNNIVSDQALFKETLDRIRALERMSDPWFITVMTGSLHPPYDIPREFLENSSSERQAALAYTDQALKRLINELKARDLLSNTLVVITSDKAGDAEQESTQAIGMLGGHNAGVLTILTPEHVERAMPDYVMQSDVMVSLLDYLQRPDLAWQGRSVFRDYKDFRPFAFAEPGLQKLYGMILPNQLISCTFNEGTCQQFKVEGPLLDENFRDMPVNRWLTQILFDSVRRSNAYQAQLPQNGLVFKAIPTVLSPGSTALPSFNVMKRDQQALVFSVKADVMPNGFGITKRPTIEPNITIVVKDEWDTEVSAFELPLRQEDLSPAVAKCCTDLPQGNYTVSATFTNIPKQQAEIEHFNVWLSAIIPPASAAKGKH